MSFRRLGPLLSFVAASALALACGGASDTDFESDDGSSGAGGSSPGGTGQGGTAGTASGSGGSSQGGSSQGGSDPTGGASGSASGGMSGTATGGGTTGGAAGTDGGAGAGGTLAGTGPGGAGGASGRAGGSGTGGTDCTAIVTSAQAALLAAQVCNPAQSSPICTGSVEDLCGCTVPVNHPESAATKSYLDQREAAVQCGVPCLAIPCREPTTSMCGIGAVANRIVAQAHCMYSPR
ncbi:MAG TPA: hypothetical protein VMS65_08935 [Polyangiaceae bacterium]|nr:hypothetical protein [Polyangiaceae bacterium]